MNCIRVSICAALIAAASIPAIARQSSTREAAVRGMRKVDPKEMDPSFTKPAPYAEKLLNDALAANPDVILMAMHVIPPHHTTNVIIASNFGRIGKKADEDDLRCIRTGKSNLELVKATGHFEDELTLKDQQGRTIGALGVVFLYKPGDDTAAMAKKAEKIRDELKTKIPTRDRLFQAAE
jgi:UDP-N-acetylmuramyl pentapeptide synthase